MADKQTAPLPVETGSIVEAQSAILGLLEPEEATPETQESAPTEDVEESTEETQDEPLEEEVLEDESEEDESEEEESEEDEVEEEPEVYAVKVDGEELEVSLEELVQGYSRHSDYTRKTQELASQRDNMAQMQQQWASEISQAQAERQQYMEAIGQFVQQSMVGLEQYASVDWESLREEDPIAFVTKKEEFRDAQERVRQAQAQQGVEAEKQKQEFAKIKQMALQEEHKKLVAAVPEWNEPEKRGELAKELSSYALSQGFKQEGVTGTNRP